jgi:hypothetical protein
VINVGWVGAEWDDIDTGERGFWKVYYDETVLPPGPAQPVINKRVDPDTGEVVPSGGTLCAFCCHNPGKAFRVEVWRPDTQVWDVVRVPKGNTTLTANQLGQWGITSRVDVATRSVPD